MKSKLLIIIGIFITLLIISVVLIFVRPKNFLSELPWINNYYSNSKLTVSSRTGILEVIVDDESFGDTPIESVELTEGKHEIKVRKIDSSGAQQFPESTFYVDLYKGTESVIDIEILPDGKYAGFILYYTKAPDSDNGKGFLTYSGTPTNANITLSGEVIEADKLKNYSINSGDYLMKINAQGYESIEIPLVIREGFNLNLKTQLMPIPINF